jgi:hypothetical protein
LLRSGRARELRRRFRSDERERRTSAGRPPDRAVAIGFTTIRIAHEMFNISFVVVTVRSRRIGFDRSIEEAAQALYANGFAAATSSAARVDTPRAGLRSER